MTSIINIQVDRYSPNLLRLWKKDEEQPEEEEKDNYNRRLVNNPYCPWFLSYQIRDEFFHDLKPKQFENLRSRLKSSAPPPQKLTETERNFIVKFNRQGNSRGPLPWLLNLRK